MYSDLFKLAINNLFRARVRLLMTMGGVFIGTVAVILLIGLTNGLQASAEADLGSNQSLTEIHVYPNQQNLELSEDVPQITLATLDKFRALEHVDSVIALLPFPQQAQLQIDRYTTPVQIFGVNPETLDDLPITIDSGAASALASGEMLLSSELLNKFTDPQTFETWLYTDVDIHSQSFRLRVSNLATSEETQSTLTSPATFSSEDFRFNAAILLPMEDVIALLGWLKGEELAAEDIVFEEALIQSTGREATLPLVDEIEALGYATDSLGDFLVEINNFFNLMRAILGGIGIVALIIAAFGVANTMMMAILERTSEIGLMKAVGARDRDVLTLFLMEAALVGLVGGSVGAIVSLFLRDRINLWIATEAQTSQLSILIDSAELQGDLMIIPNELLFFAVILATIVGVLAGAFPAWRAAKMSPVLALKEE